MQIAPVQDNTDQTTDNGYTIEEKHKSPEQVIIMITTRWRDHIKENNSSTLKTSSISTRGAQNFSKPFKKHHIYYWVFRLIFHSWFIWCPLDISRAFERTTHMTISSTLKFTNTSPYAWKYHRIDSTELIKKRGFDWQHTTEEHLSSIL